MGDKINLIAFFVVITFVPRLSSLFVHSQNMRVISDPEQFQWSVFWFIHF